MPFAEGIMPPSGDPDAPEIVSEHFEYGNVQVDATISIEEGEKARYLTGLTLSVGENSVSLTEMIPDNWRVEIANLTTWLAGEDPYKRHVRIPRGWLPLIEPMENAEYQLVEDLRWRRYREGDRPYLSNPLSIFVYFHEVGHVNDYVEAGRVETFRNAMIGALNDSSFEQGQLTIGNAHKHPNELAAMKYAVAQTGILIDKGFDFGEEFNYEAVAQIISQGLSSYEVAEPEIGQVVELARARLFGRP